MYGMWIVYMNVFYMYECMYGRMYVFMYAKEIKHRVMTALLFEQTDFMVVILFSKIADYVPVCSVRLKHTHILIKML